MAKQIKDIIAPKHSDGSMDAKDTPPTPQDVKMTVKHTSQSIIYNKPHAVDHLDEAIEKAIRLRTYEPKMAKKLIGEVLKSIKPLVKKMEKI